MALLTLPFEWLELAKHQQNYVFILIFISIFFTFILSKLIITRSFSEKLNLPPSPPRLPFLGNLHQLGPLLHRSFHNLSQKYGPLMYLRLGYSDFLVVSSSEMAREIKITHEIPFANRPTTTSTKMLFYGPKDVAFSPYGDYWRQVRKISVFEILSNKKVNSFKSVREEEVALLINKISKFCSSKTPVNISELVITVVNDISCRCAFGRKPGAKDGETNFSEISNVFTRLVLAFSFGDFFPFLAWIDVLTGLIGRMKKVSKDLDIFFDQIIDEHIIQNKQRCGDLHDHSNKDFVDTLLQVQKDNMDFTRDNIKALILDIFVGGTETTSSTIVWAMTEIVNNPHVMQKAREEIRRVVGKKNKVEEDDIQQMEYLKCVVKESFRLHPPAALLPMETSTVTTLNGYHIPAKTKVHINMWSIHRDPNLWEKPEEFIPERFSNSPINYSGKDFKYIPFGSGRRSCPGITFGTTAVELVIANLLYWYDWQTPGGEKLDMTESFGLSVIKKLPIQLLPIPLSCLF